MRVSCPRPRSPIVVVAVLLSWAALSGWAAPAAASPPIEDAKKHLKLADDHFAEKRWEQAMTEYRQALSLFHHQDIVWNIARCYEEMGDIHQAVVYFESYLQEKELTADRRADGERKVRVLRQLLDARKPARPDDSELPPPTGLSPLMISGIVTTSVGGALLIAGGAHQAWALGEAEQETTTLEQAEANDVTTIALYASAGACVVTGVLLMVLGRSEPERTGALRIGVQPLDGGAILGVAWSL